MPIQNISSLPDLVAHLNDLEHRLVQTEGENQLLREAVRHLQQRQESSLPNEAPALPRIALLSPKFITRAFAVWGHYFVAQLIISGIMLVIYLVIMIILIAAGINLNIQPPG